MKTSGMGALVISVYKKYDAVLFKGVVQSTLFPETRISAVLFEGAAQIE